MTHSPEQILWQEVLLSAVKDAVEGVALQSTSEAQGCSATKRARIYITKPNSDFDEVCSLAGFDPDAVRERVTVMIERARKSEQAGTTTKLALKPKEARSTPRPIIKITHDGHTRTLSEWAEALGIEATTIRYRYRNGWPVHRLLGPIKNTARNPQWGFSGASSEVAPKPKRKKITITHDGHTRTLSEWAEITGIKKVTIAKRLRNGWPVDAILSATDHRAANSQSRSLSAVQSRTSDDAPGVGSDFDTSLGTGGGTTLQDTPKMSFSTGKGASQ